MPIRVLHDDLRIFLNTRINEGGPDAEVSYRIVCRQHDGLPSSPNYFLAMPNPKDTKKSIISYTTDALMEKHEINRGSQRQVWNASGPHRSTLRPGRWARSMSDIEDGNALDALVMALDAEYGVGDVGVIFLEGERAINKAYLHTSHCRCVSIGDLAGSCMRYEHNQGYFDIYGMAAKLAVVKCPECKGIQARAVAWDDGTNKYIDRRYGTQQMKQAILSHAQELGYVDVWPGQVGAKAREKRVLLFPYKAKDLSAAPYLDSLYNWCRTCGTLANLEGDCKRDKHDVAVLRGTRGTDHSGWWGRCEDCGGELDHHRNCRAKRTCPGCGLKYCGVDACPNECVSCPSCGTWRTKDTPICPKGCITCVHCQYGNQQEELNQTHGRCGGCGRKIADDVRVLSVVLTYDKYGNLVGRCPNCDWNYVSQGEFSPTLNLLAKCEHVHSGPYNEPGGHCISCHAHLVFQAPVTEKPDPSKASGVTFNKYAKMSPPKMSSWYDVEPRRNR